jgi:hypothetical protein
MKTGIPYVVSILKAEHQQDNMEDTIIGRKRVSF